jgi:hypothetical protein
VNPEISSRIRTFREQVLLPALADLEELLEDSQQRVTIASNAETGMKEVDAMLQQMHFGKLYLHSTSGNALDLQASSTTPQTWIGDSVYIEILQNSEADPIRVGQYCLSIEYRILSSEHIQVVSIIGYIQAGDQALQIRQHLFDNDLKPAILETLDISDIILCFTRSFKAFEARISEPEAVFEQGPESENFRQDLAPPTHELNLDQPHASLKEQPEPSEIDPKPAPDLEPSLTPQQQLYALQQRAIDLSKKLALTPHIPLTCKLNSNLTQLSEIKAIRDRYERIVDLCLEYSPAITEQELTQALRPLGHYQSLQHLANQRRFLEAQLQTWLKQYGQPSPGAIAHRLQGQLAQQSKTLYHHLHRLAETCLADSDLQTELERATAQQQQEKDLLDDLEQTPMLGYLDTCLLARRDRLTFADPFLGNNQAIDLYAKSLKRKGKDDRPMLTHIAACRSEPYQAYRQRHAALPPLELAIRYTLTQKLYPNRPVSIGPAAQDAYPRLERLWGSTNATALPDRPLNEVWRCYPMLRTHPPQWIVMTATSETRKLKAMVLEDGRIAQEGTRAYLERALRLMTRQSQDESTYDLGTLAIAALEQGCVRWLHLHQTEDLETGEPRDIVQLQFQLSESD